MSPVPLVLCEPSERPELVTGRPELWGCRISGRQERAPARELLRAILADYLGLAPADVALRHEPGRAPALAADWRGVSLGLGISYAPGLALIGLCPGARLGVDVARVVAMPDWSPVARLYLGPQAESRLAAAPPGLRDGLFAREWAAMEARSKCLGLALQEWSAVRERRLTRSTEVASLALPADHAGADYALAVACAPHPSV